MNEKRYKGILYFIVVTMLLTVAVQCYWNYKNYLQNKQRYINDVQIALDNALENYYADLAETNQMTFIDTKSDSIKFANPLQNFNTDSMFFEFKKEYSKTVDIGADLEGFTQLIDSAKALNFSEEARFFSKVKIVRGKRASDSIKMMKGITSIFISIQNDTLDFKTLNSLVKKELKRKDINVDFALQHFKNDSLFNEFNTKNIRSDFLSTTSKTKFLKQNERLELAYPDATNIILKAGIFEIMLSLLLTLAIVSCLFYLLKIIKNQKQLAEVKNDLISNVTHEFKTPIATISVALESINDFNVIDNKEKTKSYINLSKTQLDKLNIMVEKLLETATLDSENLNLNKEKAAISDMLQALVEKHQMQTQTKQIRFNNTTSVEAFMDVFHFENAINNVIDNAVKYGGNNINISLKNNSNGFEISVSDDGKTLTKAHKDVIFEKFYRIPKGNTHDVKGFGIGLYYTKKIIEKHNGKIDLELNDGWTTFKIFVPNEHT